MPESNAYGGARPDFPHRSPRGHAASPPLVRGAHNNGRRAHARIHPRGLAMKLLLAALVVSLTTSVDAQAAAPKGLEGKEGPGVTSSVTPAPGPATTPALPSATTPAAAIANREHARAAKAARKAQKKASKAKKSERPVAGSASYGPAGTTSAPGGSSTPSPIPTSPAK